MKTPWSESRMRETRTSGLMSGGVETGPLKDTAPPLDSTYRAKATSCNSRSDGFQGQSSLRNAWSVAQCLSQDLTLFSQEPIARLSF